jgi:hypothetical protein
VKSTLAFDAIASSATRCTCSPLLSRRLSSRHEGFLSEAQKVWPAQMMVVANLGAAHAAEKFHTTTINWNARWDEYLNNRPKSKPEELLKQLHGMWKNVPWLD